MQITKQLAKYQTENAKVCKIFSKRFKEMRNRRVLTLEEIADMLGISRQSVVYYAMGDRLPSYPILIRLAKLLGSSTDYLLGVADRNDWVLK